MSFIRIQDDHETNELILRARAISLPIPKVLVLYTGGTIGMKVEASGYTPQQNFLEMSLRSLIILNDPNVAQSMKAYDIQNDLLYLPAPTDKSAVAYFIIEYVPLLDSSCMRLDEYKTIVEDIQREYDNYDGFVILHGTDTMAYTASYLSFMFENLDKPIVLTGSQIPIFETRSDARDNLTSSLIIAGLYDIPEVTILFDNKLLRGNRTTKVDCQGLHAFDTPNFPPLAEFGTSIQVRWDIILPKLNKRGLKVFTQMSSDVGIIRIFPSLSPRMIETFCSPPLEAVILHTFGMGNVPIDNPNFMDALHRILERDLIIVNCTQCQKGSVSSIYEAGSILPQIGVISGKDITIESALAKLSYVVGHKDWTLNQKRKQMDTTLRGEMTEDAMAESQLSSIPVEVVSCIEAVRSGSSGLLQLALDAGKDPNVTDSFGANAMVYAVHSKNMELINLLLKHKGQLCLSNQEIGIIACRFAAANDVDGLKCLRLAGAKLNEGDYSGTTASHVSAAKLAKDAFAYLLSCGIDMNCGKNYFAFTPKMVLKNHQNSAGAKELKTTMKDALSKRNATVSGEF